jgi:DNA-binding transcriptional ArsR family regulator
MMEKLFLQYEKELRALANYRRLKILFFLKRRKSACVLEIAEELKISFKTASKHLRRLFDVGLLARNQIGGEMHYKCSDSYDKHLESLIEML